MPLDGSRLNGARYTSCLADIQAQFPIAGGLLGPEQASLQSFQQKLAHAVADHDGTDVVAEITANALVSTTDTGSVISGAGSGGATVGTGTGTVA
jgi:hypothetical protein